MSKVSNDDEEFDDVGVAPEAVSGSVSPAGNGELDAMLLGLAGHALQIRILLEEISEDDFQRLRGRISLVRDLVMCWPTEPTKPRNPLGFRPKRRRGKKATK